MKLLHFIKKLVGWTVLILLILLISGGILAYFQQDRILEEIKKELTQSVESDLGFEQANLRFFKTFPDFSLELTQFYVLNQKNFKLNEKSILFNDTLIQAQSVFFELDIIQLFQGEVLVKSVKIDDGAIQLFENELGISNYSFLFESEEPEEDSQTIQLNSIELSQIRLAYQSLPSEISLSSKLSELKLKGKIDTLSTRFEARGEITIEQIIMDSTHYIDGFTCNLQLSLYQDDEKLILQPYHFISEDIDVQGKLDYSFASESLSILIEAKENRINQLLRISPYATSFLPDSMLVEGLLSLKGNYSINFQTDSFGKYTFETEFKKGELNFLSDSIQLIRSEAKSTIYNDAMDQIIINDLRFRTDFPLGGSAQLNARVILYEYIDLSGQLKLAIEPAQLASWSGITSANNWNGNLNGNFALRGIKLDLNQDNIKLIRELRPEGTLNISASSYKLPEYNIETPGIRIDLADENLRFAPFEIAVNEQQLKFEKLELDRIYDLINKQVIQINARIHSASLDLMKVIPVTQSKPDQSDETQSSNYTLAGMLTFQASEIIYDRFKARQVSGALQLINNQLLAKEVKMQTLNGEIELDAGIRPDPNGKNKIDLSARMNEIDLHELLFSFRNFDQTYITHKELIGDISGQINLVAKMDSGLSLDYSTVKGKVNFILKKGEITDLRSLRKMADFTHLEELQRIRFDAIEGAAELEEGQLKVYPSYIHSSVADIDFYGAHTLGKQMDYRFEILLSPDFTGKQTDHLEAVKQEGRTKLYLKLLGTEEDYAVSYDMRALKDATKERMKEEGSILKDAFQKEFGKKDTTQNNESKQPADQSVKKKTKVIWE